MKNQSSFEYFTKAQVAKIKQDYIHLIGKHFRFNEASEETSIILDIIAIPINVSLNQYRAEILFENIKTLPSFKFMPLNNIAFDFEFYSNFRTV